MKLYVTSIAIIQKKDRENSEELKKLPPHSSHGDLEFNATSIWNEKFKKINWSKKMEDYITSLLA